MSGTGHRHIATMGRTKHMQMIQAAIRIRNLARTRGEVLSGAASRRAAGV